MVVAPRWICTARLAALAANGRERFLLLFRVLDRILVNSGHRRAGAPFHGGVVRRLCAVAPQDAWPPVGWSNQTYRRGWIGGCAPRITSTTVEALGRG
jgi:hypothetical protein